MFSGTVPATRIAVASIDPVVVGVGRSVLGALLAIGYLIAIRAPRPSRVQLPGIAVVALGAGVGFGYFSAEALRTVRKLLRETGQSGTRNCGRLGCARGRSPRFWKYRSLRWRGCTKPFLREFSLDSDRAFSTHQPFLI